jgi:hypothetical protein
MAIEGASTMAEPTGLTINPLHVLLHFIAALPGGDPFAELDAGKMFEAMRSEVPSLTPLELVWAGGVASQLGKQLRSLSWCLRGGGQKRKPAKERPRRRQAVRIDPNDPKILALPAVMAHWREHLGLKTKWRIAQVIVAARNADDFEAALLSVAGADGSISKQRLGIWLSKVEGRSVDGMIFRCVEVRNGYPRWVLELRPHTHGHEA